jgi:hypothetical protein
MKNFWEELGKIPAEYLMMIARNKNNNLQSNIYCKEFYTIFEVAELNGIACRKISWEKLKRISARRGYFVKPVFNTNWSAVNSYHRDVWRLAYPNLALFARK